MGGTLLENARAAGRINTLSVNGQIGDWATIWKAALINPDMSAHILANIYTSTKEERHLEEAFMNAIINARQNINAKNF